MNILLINEFGKSESKVTDILPRVGDKIDVFYEPVPTVTMVLLYPSRERMVALGYDVTTIHAIVTVR